MPIDHITSALGYFILQHHDKSFEPHARIMAKGHRPLNSAPGEYMSVNSLTEGPIVGWHLLETEDQEKFPRLWAQSIGAAADDKGWTPRGINWESPQEGLAKLPAISPFELEYPDGYPSVLVAGADMDSQAQLSSPSWAGLVVPTKAGAIELSSVAWDVKPVRGLDTAERAPVTSAWRLYSIPRSPRFGPLGAAPAGSVGGGAAVPVTYSGIAWQLGLAPRGSNPGLGMTAEDGFGRKILAAGGVRGGGPFDVGGESDQHRIAETPSGEKVNALHLSTQSILIRPDGSGDSTLEDGGVYRQCRAGPLLIRAHWRHDAESFHRWEFGAGAGLWRWQASSFIATIPDGEERRRFPPFPPLPPDPPPRPLPPFGVPGADRNFLPGPRLTPGGGVEPGPGQWKPLASASGELGVRGIVYRENARWGSFPLDSNRDFRNAYNELGSDGIRDWAEAPSIIRTDTAASPTTLTGSRYEFVASGAVWHLAAEQGLEDTLFSANQGYEPSINPYTIGERLIAYGRGVNLAWGSPAANAPWLVASGWKLGQGPSTTTLNLWSLNSSGAATVLAAFTSGGVSVVGALSTSLGLSSGTSVTAPAAILNAEAKTLTLEQESDTWAAHRTQQFQDRNGVVALTAMRTSGESANFTAVKNTIHGIDTSGGAITVALPAITDILDQLDGMSIVLADISGDALANNVTVNTDGSDLILGATSTAIEDNYGVLCLRAIVVSAQGYWIIC